MMMFPVTQTTAQSSDWILMWSNDCGVFEQLLQHVQDHTSQSDHPASLSGVPQPPTRKRNPELGKGSHFLQPQKRSNNIHWVRG